DYYCQVFDGDTRVF
nr:immunoglobulin light chain junction region [Macaca mulatta]